MFLDQTTRKRLLYQENHNLATKLRSSSPMTHPSPCEVEDLDIPPLYSIYVLGQFLSIPNFVIVLFSFLFFFFFNITDEILHESHAGYRFLREKSSACLRSSDAS